MRVDIFGEVELCEAERNWWSVKSGHHIRFVLNIVNPLESYTYFDTMTATSEVISQYPPAPNTREMDSDVTHIYGKRGSRKF